MSEFNYAHVRSRVQRARATAPRICDDLQYAPFVIRRRNRFWEVSDDCGNLICLTVYKRGAREVARRLSTNGAAVEIVKPCQGR